MRAMSRVERFFERLVERPSARIFRTRLQPIQVLRRIERAMESERGAEGRPGLVPDQFVVHIHPDDLAGLGAAADVAGELASGVLTFARSHGYALRERPRVTLQPDSDLRPGDVEVDATLSPNRAEPPDSRVVDAGTRVFEVPVMRGPGVMIAVKEPNRPSRRVPAGGAPISIGRAPDCGLVLKDSRASRRHARLTARDGLLVLTDLGSTNGTRVNGHRVSEVVLGAGDRITIGETTLTIEPAAAATGTTG
jgi:FhaA, N-terminal domain/FHA domain